MSRMDFNALRPTDSPPKPRQLFFSTYMSRDASVDGSINSEDPLATQPSPRRVASPPRASSSQTKLAVVLNASPGRRGPQVITIKDSDEDAVTSDLSQFRQEGRPNQSVPLIPKPSEKPTSAPTGRPRGRPKGSGLGPRAHKTSSSTAAGSREARQVKVRPSMNGFSKRRGRPPKAPSPPPRAIYESLNPPFIEFLCEWKDCKAELHNLATLRRHIYIVHGQEGDRPHCSWGKCGVETPVSFETEEAFEEHVEEAHLVPFAWHIGDGPSNENPGKAHEVEMPDFLKDKNGEQVTPWVRDQQVEDLQTWRNNRKKLKDLLRQRDENLPDGESEELDEEML